MALDSRMGSQLGALITTRANSIKGTTSEISDERARDLADVCFPLIASEQTGGSCWETIRARYVDCKPGGYSLGYFGEDGDGCAVD